ncbi:hypothetical protein D3C83_170990 [compost metagenome]
MQGNIDDLMGKFAKAVCLFWIVQLFGFAAKRLGRLHDHKLVDNAVHFMEPNVENIEFIQEEKTIVDHWTSKKPREGKKTK